MSLDLKDKFGMWLDEVKDKIYNVFGKDKSEKEAPVSISPKAVMFSSCQAVILSYKSIASLSFK